MADIEIKHKLTREEAKSLLKRAPKGTKFAVHINADVPLVDDDTQVFPHCGSGYVNLSRAEAIRIASDFITDKIESRGGRVPITVRTWTSLHTSSTTYWIG